jgi:pilus assembly protein Flp/PilA
VIQLALLSLFCRLLASRCGATAIEYAIVAALISVACISSLTTIGRWIGNILTAAADAMT